MPQPIVTRSTREQITDDLREDVLCARISPGSRLSEVELAKRFGVSRGPVREALSHLVCEGLLVSKPNCGVSVAPTPTNEIRDLIVPIRRTIETYALKLCFEKLTPGDFVAWEAIVLKMEQACRQEDEKEIVLQDINFHRSIIARAEQPELLVLWQAILVQVRGHFCEEVHRRRNRYHLVPAHHRNLIDAFRKGDLKTAVAALKRHIM